jgi:hemoglobin/transferrin/lactoferrin receptor protein
MRNLLWLMAVCLLGKSASAQQPVSIDTSSKEKDLPELIISANRTLQDRMSIPHQVAAIPAARIRFGNFPSMAEVLQNSGTLFVQKSQQGGGSPVIRGFEASRVLLVIDDVRMNNLIYRAGHLQNVITVDPNLLDRVEVLYGPSSTVYGSDALGGVVHLRTRKPEFSTDGRLLAKGSGLMRYASANRERTVQANINLGRSNFASLTSITYSMFDDLRMGMQPGSLDSAWSKRYYYVERIDGKDSLVRNKDPYVQKFSGYDQLDLMQKFSLKSGEHAVHGLNLQFSTSTDIPRYDRLTDPGANVTLNSAEWYYGPQDRFLAAYHYDRKITRGFFDAARAVLSYQYVVESRHSRGFAAANRTNRTEYVNVAAYTFGLDRNRGPHQVRLGVDGQYSAVNSVANRYNVNTGALTEQSTRYPDGDNAMNLIAAYVTHTWEVSPCFSVHDGLRLTSLWLESSFEDTSFFPFPVSGVTQQNTVLAGNLGVVWRPDLHLKISLLGTTGFRAPNVDDLAKVFESTPGKLIIPNPDLKPERTASGELGFTVFLGKDIRWENVGFYTAFTDAIVTDVTQFNGQDSVLYDGSMSRVYSSQNKQEAYLYGFSSAVEVEVGRDWHIVGSVNYTYGRVKTDTVDIPLDHIPPLYGRFAVRYQRDRFEAEASTVFNGKKDIDDYNPFGEDNQQYATSIGMPSWYTLNLRAQYSLKSYLTLQLGLDNLMDQNYRTFASGIQAPGRNLIAAVRVKW